MRRSRLLILGALIFVLVGYWESPAVPRYVNHCTGEGQNEHCPQYEGSQLFFVELSEFLDAHAGSIGAFSGIAVAFFTFTLWRSTDKLWKAGERQQVHARRGLRVQIASTKQSLKLASESATAAKLAADAADLSAKAAVGVELPVLFIEEIRPFQTPSKDDTGSLEELSIVIKIRNYGRTPAFISEILINHRVSESIELTPNYEIVRAFFDRIAIVADSIFEFTEHSLQSAYTPSSEELRLTCRSSQTQGLATN